MLRELQTDGMIDAPEEGWLDGFVHDYRRRVISLLSYNFSSLPINVAVTLIDPTKELSKSVGNSVDDDISTDVSVSKTQLPTLYSSQPVHAQELVEVHMTMHDIKRLELYARNMVSSLLSICCFVYTLLFLVHDCDCLFAYVVSSEQVDHHMVLDIMPIVARLLFSGRIPSVRLSQLQLGVLLAVGLQQKTVDAIGETS